MLQRIKESGRATRQRGARGTQQKTRRGEEPARGGGQAKKTPPTWAGFSTTNAATSELLQRLERAFANFVDATETRDTAGLRRLQRGGGMAVLRPVVVVLDQRLGLG